MCRLFIFLSILIALIDAQKLNGPVKILNSNDVTKPSKNLLNIEVYMESRCSDTTRFLKTSLLPLWKELNQYLDVTLVPFGKANCTRKNNDFECKCQHGPLECQLNTLMNCVIEEKKRFKDYVNLISCIQGKASTELAVEDCLRTEKNKEKLKTCMNSKHGRSLLTLAEQKTKSLSPKLNFIPWILLNGKHNEKAFEQLKEEVCKQSNLKSSSYCKAN